MAKHTLDPETRFALALLCGYSNGSTYVFTPERFQRKRPDGEYFISTELWPKITLRPYTPDERSQRRKMMIDSYADVHKVKADDVFKFVAGVIVAWDNLVDPATGDPIPFSTEAVKQLSDLTIKDILETSDQISGLTNADKLGFGY